MVCCHGYRRSETACPRGITYLARQVPDLQKALERCIYAESIAADLLDGTGDRYRGLSLVVALHTRERIISTNEGCVSGDSCLAGCMFTLPYVQLK